MSSDSELAKEIRALRTVLLVLLWHTIDSNASDKYIRGQMHAAGATDAEIDIFVEGKHQ